VHTSDSQFHISAPSYVTVRLNTVRYESLTFNNTNVIYITLKKLRQEVSLKCYQIFNRLHGITPPKAIFIITASW